MTRAQLRSLVRDYLQESTQVPLTDAIVNDLLTQAEETLSDLGEYSAATFTDTFVTNDFDYELPKTLLSVLSVAWNDSSGNRIGILGPTTHQRMEAELPSWRTDAAARPERWWILGDALMVHPKPSATYNLTTFEIYGTAVPTPMAGDGSEPSDLPQRFHRTLAKFAAWKWLAIDKENPAAVRMAGFWQAEFQADAQRLRHFYAGRVLTDGYGPRVERGAVSPVTWPAIDPEDE